MPHERQRLSALRLSAVSGTPPILLVLLALVPATSGTARGLLVPGLKVSDLIVIALIVLIVLKFSVQRTVVNPLGWTLLAYGTLHLAFTAVNFVRRPDLAGTPPLEIGKELISALQYGVIFLVAVVLSRESKSPSVWVFSSLGLASVIAVVAFLQEMDFPGIREVLSALTGNPGIISRDEWQDSRGTGPFYSWHALGIYLSMHATIALALLLRTSMSNRGRVAVSVALACLVLGMGAALTLTPAALTVAALMLLIPWRRFPRRALGATLGGIGVIGVATIMAFWPEIVGRLEDQGETITPGLPRTIAYRLLFWTRDYLPLVRANIWTGYGPLGPDDNIYPHAESMYVSVLMAGGGLLLLGLLAVMATSIVTMLHAQRSLASASIASGLARAGLIIAVFFVFAQAIHPYFDDAGGAPLFVVLLGIVVGQSLRDLDEQHPSHLNGSTDSEVRS